MKLPRRQFLHLAAGATALPVFSRIARAQAYPSRTVTLVVPFAAGGTTDVAARIVGEHMSRTLGQQFIVENVPGAGGTTGSIRAMRAKSDLHHPDGRYEHPCLFSRALPKPRLQAGYRFRANWHGC